MYVCARNEKLATLLTTLHETQTKQLQPETDHILSNM